MEIRHRHEWNVTPAAALEIQDRLRDQIEIRDRFGPVTRVGGVDVGFEQGGSVTRAAAVVLSFPQLDLLDSRIVRLPTSFPYVPGLLSFRELPAVIKALEALEILPDLLLCDGQGIAHPRRLGIATHLGILTDLPTIGVAKSRLTGTYREPGAEKGAWETLYDGEEMIGAVVRSRSRVKPLFVSPGHRISQASAVEYTLACTTRFKLPETTRWADRLASA